MVEPRLMQDPASPTGFPARVPPVPCETLSPPLCAGVTMQTASESVTAEPEAIPSWKCFRGGDGGHQRAPHRGGSAQHRGWRRVWEGSKSARRGFSLGPALEAQRGLETPKMPLCSVCGYFAAAKSSFVQQVPGLITG